MITEKFNSRETFDNDHDDNCDDFADMEYLTASENGMIWLIVGISFMILSGIVAFVIHI